MLLRDSFIKYNSNEMMPTQLLVNNSNITNYVTNFKLKNVFDVNVTFLQIDKGKERELYIRK